MLSDEASVCRPHARWLADEGLRLVNALPTPIRTLDEPEPHEWIPKPSLIVVEELLKAA